MLDENTEYSIHDVDLLYGWDREFVMFHFAHFSSIFVYDVW